MRPDASEEAAANPMAETGANPIETQVRFEDMKGMSSMQNFMIIGLVFAIVALYVRHRMRADAAVVEKARV